MDQLPTALLLRRGQVDCRSIEKGSGFESCRISEREEKGEYHLLVKELRLQDAEYLFEFVVRASVTDNCLSQEYTVAAESSIILACCWLSTNLILANYYQKSSKFYSSSFG